MARNEKEIQDKKGEKIVQEFLYENFYSNYSGCLVTDKERQIKGIDSIMYTEGYGKGFEYKIDEKAALDYINKEWKLNTFCLELSCLNRNDELMEGWFTDDKMENNSYLFVWVDKAKNDILTCADDILEAEMSLILKKDIYDYLNSIGWTKNKLRLKCEKIRNDENENLGNHKTNGCKFSFAKHLPEKPINILLQRRIYNSLPNTINIKFKK